MIRISYRAMRSARADLYAKHASTSGLSLVSESIWTTSTQGTNHAQWTRRLHGYLHAHARTLTIANMNTNARRHKIANILTARCSLVALTGRRRIVSPPMARLPVFKI